MLFRSVSQSRYEGHLNGFAYYKRNCKFFIAAGKFVHFSIRNGSAPRIHIVEVDKLRQRRVGQGVERSYVDAFHSFELGFVLQDEDQQHKFKIAAFLDEADDETLHKIEKAFLKNQIEINLVYSKRMYLDIIPSLTNKGKAGEFLANYLAESPTLDKSLKGKTYFYIVYSNKLRIDSKVIANLVQENLSSESEKYLAIPKDLS